MPMRLGTPIPAIEGATDWFNDATFTSSEFGKQPTLVHFWSVSCHICHEVMDEVVSYQKRYASHGLQMVGIHMPKQQSDTDVELVKQDIQSFHIEYPVAVDNLHKIAEAYQNQFVPAFFLFDGDGKLYFRAAGDKGFQNLQPKIEAMLGITADES
jgi:thiol-disulfide isomerase/thioredoxin